MFGILSRDDTADMLYVKHSVLVSAERHLLDVSSDVPWNCITDYTYYSILTYYIRQIYSSYNL